MLNHELQCEVNRTISQAAAMSTCIFPTGRAIQQALHGTHPRSLGRIAWLTIPTPSFHVRQFATRLWHWLLRSNLSAGADFVYRMHWTSRLRGPWNLHAAPCTCEILKTTLGCQLLRGWRRVTRSIEFGGIMLSEVVGHSGEIVFVHRWLCSRNAGRRNVVNIFAPRS